MSEKQDTLGCCYFIGTHIWKHTQCLTKKWRLIHPGCVCACTACTFTPTCTCTQTVSLIRPGSCCCERGNYSMRLSEALMESFRLTGSTVRSLDSASFLTRTLYGSFCSLFSLKHTTLMASWKVLFYHFEQTYKKNGIVLQAVVALCTITCCQMFCEMFGSVFLSFFFSTEVCLLCLHAVSDSCGTMLGEMMASLLKPLTASCVRAARGLVHSLCVMCLLW